MHRKASKLELTNKSKGRESIINTYLANKSALAPHLDLYFATCCCFPSQLSFAALSGPCCFVRIGARNYQESHYSTAQSCSRRAAADERGTPLSGESSASTPEL